MNDMNENFDAFDEYALQYDLEETALKRKYEHSYRVVHQADEIAYTLKLDEEDSYLACLIALLHDIGRFSQWKEYHTYNDLDSIDHATLGNKKLFEDNLIKKFKLDKKDYEIVRAAIENHNKFSINEKELSEKEILHSKIVRDADKIDILYEFSNPKLLDLNGENNDEVNDKIKEDFYNHKPIDRKIIKNKNENVIMLIALVYDLYFDYSKKTVLEKEYLDRMLERLKNKKLFKSYIEEAKKYLKGSDK